METTSDGQTHPQHLRQPASAMLGTAPSSQPQQTVHAAPLLQPLQISTKVCNLVLIPNQIFLTLFTS